MGSPAMAVRLILVTLVVVLAVSVVAQQSEKTGGRTKDRRLNIRRFSARRKAEGAREKPRKFSATKEDLERRRLLFQRNPLNRNRGSVTQDKSVPDSKPAPLPIRRQRPTPTVRPSNEIDIPVVRISNNDLDIQDLVLRRDEESKEQQRPFKGISEVRTVSEPSGFRSLNEQIVRVSFKKSPVEESSRRELFRRPSVATTSRTIEETDPLLALIRTVSEPIEVTTKARVVEEEPLSVEMQAAIREMDEDNQKEKALEGRRRLIGRDRTRIRVGVRARSGHRNPQKAEEEVEQPRQQSVRARFNSFPSRQGDRAELPRQRPRIQPRLREQSTPPPATTTLPEVTFPALPQQSFTTAAPAPVVAASEAPRSAFTLDQSFGGEFFQSTPGTVQPQPQRIEPAQPTFQPAERFPQRIEPAQAFQPQAAQPRAQPFQAFQSQPIQPRAQPVQPVQPVQPRPQPVQPRTQSFQAFQPQPLQPRPQPVQPSTQSFQPRPQPVQPRAQPFQVFQPQPVPPQAQPAPSFSSQPLQQAQQPTAGNVLPQNPFTLLNTNNFQAFDAQFGGSVPVTPGAAQFSSGIFANQAQQQQRFQPPQLQVFQPQNLQALREQQRAGFSVFSPSGR